MDGNNQTVEKPWYKKTWGLLLLIAFLIVAVLVIIYMLVIKEDFNACPTSSLIYGCGSPKPCKENFSVSDVVDGVKNAVSSVFGGNKETSTPVSRVLDPETREAIRTNEDAQRTLRNLRSYIINLLNRDESVNDPLFTDLNTDPLRERLTNFIKFIEDHKLAINRLLHVMSKRRIRQQRQDSGAVIDLYTPFESIMSIGFVKNLGAELATYEAKGDTNNPEYVSKKHMYDLLQMLSTFNCVAINLECARNNLNNPFAPMSMDAIQGSLARVLRCTYRDGDQTIPIQVRALLKRYNTLPDGNATLVETDSDSFTTDISDAMNSKESEYLDSTEGNYLETIVSKVIPAEQFERQANFNNEIYGFKGATIQGIWEAANPLVPRRGLMRQTGFVPQTHGFDGAPSSIMDLGRDQDQRPFLTTIVGSNAIAGTSD